ncbi:NAD(P)H-dependent FMN reductase [Aliiruegeria haliotis]|uniref:NAD(P)H-dependent FMN reductase n=1 Tax=Aliiruegeria haliotis TaxID=1280846 RepID=A0A2T0S0M5_9RHOB|nr:NAD(P)H-dependent oxidoreductase [Aliiruegeria haliotis]PRY26853.1 NAD(P)H-dependent FMN reductase [Aliiruegeria haliotis]
MHTPRKILAFAASNNSNSINKRLAEHAAEVFKAEIAPDSEIETIDLNDFEMPIYSPDRELAGGVPAEARAFFDKIGAADAVIVSFAEHNGSYTSAFKNVFDWASRIDMGIYQNKPVVMLATSPGPRGGTNVLGTATATAPFFGADLRGSLAIGSYFDKVDAETGIVTSPDEAAALRSALSGLTQEQVAAA